MLIIDYWWLSYTQSKEFNRCSFNTHTKDYLCMVDNAISDTSKKLPAMVAPSQSFFALRANVGNNRKIVLGVIGAVLFFGTWEIAHYMMDETQQKFLPSVEQVLSALWVLFTEKAYIHDVLKSTYRVFVSFFVASAIALPLAILMGCFANIKALMNPVLSAARYLPAASFIPLLLVWFGPTDLQKMSLLFLGVVFFLVALMLDSTESVETSLVEASLTMGASRRQVVLGVVLPAAAPSIVDAMRAMIAVSWTYLVIAEIVSAQDGIGAVMMRAGRFLKVDIIMAGILTIGILGVLTDLLFRFSSHLIFPWNRPRKA